MIFYFEDGERVEGEDDWDYEIPEDIDDNDDEYDTTEGDDTTEGVDNDAYDTEGIFDNGDEGKQDDEGLLEP